MIKNFHKTIHFFSEIEIGIFTTLLLIFPFLCFGNTEYEANEVISHLNIYGNNEKVWFIPGWKASTTQVGEYMNLLKAIYKSSIYILNWDSNQSWSRSKQNTKEAAQKLVYRLSLLSTKQQNEIILIGHSLGARVIANAAMGLFKKGYKVKKVVFLGAAVDYDAAEIDIVEKISLESPINVFSKDDGILKYAYGNAEDKVACGCFGITGEHRFKQYSMPMDSHDSIIESLEVHYMKNYCSYLDKIENQTKLKAIETLDLESIFKEVEKVLIQADIELFPKPFLPNELIMGTKVIHEKDGWKLLNLGKLYAISDPLGRIVSYGNIEKNMLKQWTRIINIVNKQ